MKAFKYRNIGTKLPQEQITMREPGSFITDFLTIPAMLLKTSKQTKQTHNECIKPSTDRLGSISSGENPLLHIPPPF